MSDFAFAGTYYDGLSARHCPVQVVYDHACEWLAVKEPGTEFFVPIRNLRLEAALGSTPRVIHLPGNARLVTTDQAAMALLEKRLTPRQRTLETWVDRIERNKLGVLASTLGVLAFGFLCYSVIIPQAADSIASKLPPEIMNRVSEESLQWIDSKLMDPSELAPERQEALRSGFRSWAAALPEAPAWKLLFRKSGIGPNAFALPDGTILMTDELVALAEKDEEIYAVLGHELGHIHHRHSMRMVARQTALAVVTTFLFGDLNSIASVVAGLPLFLSQNGYSREFEHEADVYGAHLCVKNLAGMQPMVLILEKLEKAQPSEDMPGWLSTHPHTPERIRHLHEQGE